METSKPITAEEAKFIVVPKWPTIDKVIAAWLVMEKAHKHLPVVSQANQRITDNTWKRWSEGGAYVLDLATQKYQRQDDGSTSQTVARSENLTDPITQELVRLTCQNNQTGGLKQCPHAIAKIMREAYELDGVGESEVINSVMEALDAWAHGSAKIEGHNYARTLNLFVEKNPDIVEVLTLNADGQKAFKEEHVFGEFSVGQLAVNLWLNKTAPEIIKAKVNWWLELEKRIRQEWLALPGFYEEAKKHEFAHGRAIVIRTNSRKMAGWMWKKATNSEGRKFQLIVTRRDKSDPRKRNVAILAGGKKLDLQGLANVLYLLEGHAHYNGFWYHQLGEGKSQANFLLNGTPERAVPATWLTDDQLVTLIELLVFNAKKLNQTQAETMADELISGQPTNRPQVPNLRSLLVIALQGKLRAGFAENYIAKQAKAKKA